MDKDSTPPFTVFVYISAWFHNLVANPIVTVERGTEQFEARATVPEGLEHTRLYDQMSAQMPGFAEYQRNTTRKIPVVVLEQLV